MNREIPDLVLLFTSAFVGATIAFLTALITFTFHHEIRECLIQRGLIVPPYEPEPANPALRLLLERREQGQNQMNPEGDSAGPRRVPLYILQRAGHTPGLPVRLPLNYEPQNDPNRHLQLEDFPTAFTTWRNRNHDPWTKPPDQGPWRLLTDRTIWDPHPQYILDWDQPVALEQQPVDTPPVYQHRLTNRESTMDGPHRRLRRADPDHFPTPRRAIGLPSTSNNDPSQISDTDTLVDHDVPEQIQIHPDVPHDIEPDKDQRTPRELLLLETQGEEDPFNVDRPDFEWPELAPVDREIMGATRATAWEFRR